MTTPTRIFRRCACALLLMAPLAGPLHADEAPAPPPKAFPYAVERFSLKNGLQVVMVPRPGTGLLAYYTLVRVGSRNEVEPGRSGYAHFFEHMMFRGTERYPQHRYESVIKKYGANNNAYTDDDLTVYTIFGRADGLESFVEIEADRFQNLKYSRAAFETEAKAVLGEYLKAKSNPDSKMYEELCNAAFTRHSYKHTTIGFEADVRAMPKGFDYSLGFFRNYYTPDNATVILVGDFEPANARALIEQAYGGWKGKAVLPKLQKEPAQKAERRVDLRWDRPARPKMMMGWHVPEASPRTVKDVVVADLVEELLFGETSPVYRDLVLESQLSDSLGAWAQEHRDPHLFIVVASAKEPSQLAEVEARIDAAIAKAAAEGVDPARLEAVKSHQRYALLSSMEKLDHVADIIATSMSPTGDLEWLEQQFAALGQVTNDDVKAFISKHLVKNNRTVVTLRVPGDPNAGSK